MQTFKYGAMSSLYSCEAENKLTAYCAMIVHFKDAAHLIALFEPEEIKPDSWLSLDGKISERLDEIFGGKGSLEKYLEENLEAIKTSYETIKKLI